MTEHDSRAVTAVFEQVRERLWSIAYRMLGSVADAEDALQDIYIKWQGADHAGIDKPEAWLVRACTNRCIDLLRSKQRSRVDYVGMWLPEPVMGEASPSPGEHAELASSLSMAFLLLLERLSPAERAAYLLREIFDYSYEQIAGILGKREAACRKLVSRAQGRLGGDEVRAQPSEVEQQTLLSEFLAALASGDTARLERVLSEDVEFWGDGGGKAITAPEVIHRAREVAAFLAMVWQRAWKEYDIVPTMLNAAVGALLLDQGKVVGTLSLAGDGQGRCERILVVRNPDKLERIRVS